MFPYEDSTFDDTCTLVNYGRASYSSHLDTHVDNESQGPSLKAMSMSETSTILSALSGTRRTWSGGELNSPDAKTLSMVSLPAPLLGGLVTPQALYRRNLFGRVYESLQGIFPSCTQPYTSDRAIDQPIECCCPVHGNCANSLSEFGVMEGGEMRRICSQLLDHIKYGNYVDCVRALAMVSDIAVRRGKPLKDAFVQYGVAGAILKITSPTTKKPRTLRRWLRNSGELIIYRQRALAALEYAENCELPSIPEPHKLRACVLCLKEGDAESRSVAMFLVNHLSDPRYSFIATRILATLLRLKPALIAYSHYYEVLLKLLDHIPSLHDYDGFDCLYARSLEEHKRLLPDHDNSWPYDCETLKSSDLVALKGLITTVCGKKYRQMMKRMPGTYRVAKTIKVEPRD